MLEKGRRSSVPVIGAIFKQNPDNPDELELCAVQHVDFGDEFIPVSEEAISRDLFEGVEKGDNLTTSLRFQNSELQKEFVKGLCITIKDLSKLNSLNLIKAVCEEESRPHATLYNNNMRRPFRKPKVV